MANQSLASKLDTVPVRNLKAGLRKGEGAVQKLNVSGGKVLDQARFLAGVEPKAMAEDTQISESLVHRALKSDDPSNGDIGFVRLWHAMGDAFWLELGLLILKTRGSKRVRHLFEIEDDRKVG